MRKIVFLALALICGSPHAEVWQARYGVAETYNFKLYNADGTLDVDEADGGTEVSLACNEGAETTATNDFVDEGTFYSIALTATEMQCERIAVVIAATTTEVFFIQTNSNASAMTPANDVNVVNFGGTAGTFASGRPEVNTTHAAGTAWNSGAIGPNTLASDTITAAKAAADLTTELQVGLATSSSLTTVGTNVSTLLEALIVLGAEQTADSGTTTTIVDAALTQGTDGWFNGMAVHFTSGTLLGQASCATGFTASSDTLTFSPAVTTAVTTHTYYLLPDAECQTGDGFGRIGAAGAGLTNIDLPNQTMDITGTITTATNVTNLVTSNMTQLSGDSAAADRLEAILDGTCGSYPELGITRGVGCTAQAYTAGTPSLTLDTSAAFGDNTLEGATILICGSTQGYCQPATAVSNVGSTDVVTLREALPVAATGTVTFTIFGTATGGGDVNVTTIEGTDATTVLGTAQTGDAYARLGAPAGASVSADVAAVKSDSAAILVDTSTTLDDLVDDLESRLGTPSNLGGGATVAANLADIEGQTDDIGVAGAGLTATDDAVMTRLGAPVGASLSADIAGVESGISWNSAWDAEVESEANDALVAIHLDHLLAADYDPASKPGVVTALLNELVESDSGVSRFTANALEQAPTGGGETLDAIADAVWDELLSGHAVSGSTGEALTSAAAGGGLDAAGVRAAIGLATANLDTQLSGVQSDTNDIQTRLPAALVSGRMDSSTGAMAANVMTAAAAAADLTTELQSGLATSSAVSSLDTKIGTPAGASVSADVAEVESQTDDIGVAGAGLTAVDDAVLAAIAALNNLSANQVRDLVIEDQGGGVSLGCALAVLLAYASGDIVTSGTSTTYEEPSGTETRTTGTAASAGNRTATITCPTY